VLSNGHVVQRPGAPVWIGANGVQDISFTYDPAALPTSLGQPLVVGAESDDGSAGSTILGEPTQDLVVTSTAAVAGESKTFGVDLLAKRKGAGSFTSSLRSPLVDGTAITVVPFTISAP
jgi:hypothetical protein